MTETVRVDIEGSATAEQKADAIRQSLPSHMDVYVKDGDVRVDVPEARDAEDEVTNALNDAGVRAYVEKV